MRRDDPWYDRRPTDEIIASILTGPNRDDESYEDNHYWPNVGVICHRLTPDVLKRAIELCHSTCRVEQRLGCDILGGLGQPDHPFRDESVGPVLRVLDSADDLETMGVAIANLGCLRHSDAAPALLQFLRHPDDGIRYALAGALPAFAESRGVIYGLIELMRDSDPDVRDWTTFGIGSQIEADGPEIRAALWERTADLVAIVRAEALSGLVARRVPGTFEALQHEIRQPDVEYPVVRAIEELGDPRCLPLMEDLYARFPNWDDVNLALGRMRSA
jgi:HEAT repeat protein